MKFLLREREPQLLAFDFFGPTNDAVVEMIGQLTQAGVPITVKPLHLDGFTRSSVPQKG